MEDNNRYERYSEHYRRGLNRPPDWELADLTPQRFACNKPWLPSDKCERILDLGCGWGRFLMSLWCAGYRNIEGVDISPEMVEIACEACRGRVPIEIGDGESFLKERAGVYGLICIFDVIEHIALERQHSFLRSVYHALRPDGIIVVRTGNMCSILAAHARYFDVTHTSGFTEFSLQQLLEQAGFTDHRLTPDDWGWDPLAWRPWRPWRGLALRGAINHVIHRFAYWLRNAYPAPTRYGYNIEMFSRRP